MSESNVWQPQLHPRPLRRAQESVFPDDSVLIVGTPDSRLAFTDQELRFVTDADSPFGLVAFLPGADVAGTLADLAQRGRLAVPIADFTGDALSRADFEAGYFSTAMLHEAVLATQPIRERLRAYPKLPAGREAALLSVLLLAASRDVDIRGRADAHTSDGISYPLLAGLPDSRVTLEALAEARLLKRRFLDRLHLCGTCGGARLFAREVCPSCGIANLVSEDVVHHYRCGYQGARSGFEHGASLTCPKCRRDLRHYGVDYDTPSTITVCRECAERAPEPEVTFRCGDCGGNTRAVDAATRDWFDYSLLPQAYDVLQQGRMPDLSWQGILSDISGRRSPRDLGMFIDHARHLRERYQREFAVLVIDDVLPEAVIRRTGLQAQQRVRNLVVDVVRQTLRATDLVTTYDDKVLLFLPETPPDHLNRVRERLNERIKEVIGADTGIQAESVEGERLDEVLTRLLES